MLQQIGSNISKKEKFNLIHLTYDIIDVFLQTYFSYIYLRNILFLIHLYTHTHTHTHIYNRNSINAISVVSPCCNVKFAKNLLQIFLKLSNKKFSTLKCSSNDCQRCLFFFPVRVFLWYDRDKYIKEPAFLVRIKRNLRPAQPASHLRVFWFYVWPVEK